MQRRDFLGFTAVVSGGMLLSVCGESTAADPVATQQKPEGAVTLYYEFRVAPAPSANGVVLENIENLKSEMLNKTGFLSLSLKQMTGESTMVKNYPDSLKGALGVCRTHAQLAAKSIFWPSFCRVFVK